MPKRKPKRRPSPIRERKRKARERAARVRARIREIRTALEKRRLRDRLRAIARDAKGGTRKQIRYSPGRHGAPDPDEMDRLAETTGIDVHALYDLYYEGSPKAGK